MTPRAEPLVEGPLLPAGEARSEIRVLNSRFIATAGPALTVEDARTFIARIRGEFATATHHVPAYLIGHGASVVAHCSDAGEPSGTAGPPILAVLRGSGFGDVVMVVTRYFGGTKLGTGGLVRAYGDAARAVLEELPRAVKVATCTVAIEVPYSSFEQARLLAAAQEGQLLEQSFAAAVSLLVRLPESRWPTFLAALQELTAGQAKVRIVERNEATIMPIPR